MLLCIICEAHTYFSSRTRVHGLAFALVYLPQQKPEETRTHPRVKSLKSEGENGRDLFDLFLDVKFKEFFTYNENIDIVVVLLFN